MQPYFFPYLGYWQLINAVDEYVIYDDVNFIKGGWINRNRLLVNGNPSYFNVQMNGASSFKKINEIEVNDDKINKRKMLETLYNCYGKAPYFNEAFPVLSNIINSDEKNLAKYLENSIIQVCNYLGINTKIIISSDISKNNDLKGKAKVIHICKLLGASDYLNAIGGKELYDYDSFEKEGIQLHFLKTNIEEYKQFKNEFVPGLSIIDIMMFNSKSTIQDMLNNYELIDRSYERRVLK